MHLHRLILVLFFVGAFAGTVSSSKPFELPTLPQRLEVNHVPPLVKCPPNKEQLLKQTADKWGVPANALWGIWSIESGRGKNTNHINPIDQGELGLHESAAIHAERVRKLGREYNANKFEDAIEVAAMVLLENYWQLFDWDLAIGAYNRGVWGVQQRGIPVAYVAIVKRYAEASPFV